MSFRIGDPIFNHLAEPGVVVKSEKIAEVKIDTDQASLKQHFRHGYIKGLNDESRLQFNSIMDEVKALKEPNEKVALLENKIKHYEELLNPRSRQMLGYLKAEMAHILNTYNYKPRYFELPATRSS